MPTLVYCTGFEHGVATLTVNGGGLARTITGVPPQIEVIGAAAIKGNYGLKIAPTATLAARFEGCAYTANAIQVGGIHIKVTSLPAADCLFISGEAIGSTANPSICFNATSGKLAVCTANSNGTGIADKVDFGVVIIAGTVYWCSWKFDCSAATWSLRAQLNGANEGVTTSSQASDTIDALRLGHTGTSGPAHTTYFDDAGISVTAGDYPKLESRVVGLSPNGAGTSVPNPATKIQDNASVLVNDSSNPANIELDDVPISVNTDYIKQITIGVSDYVEVNFADISNAQSVNGARAILAYMSSSTAANNGTTKMIDEDGTGTNIFSGDMSESSMFYKSIQMPTPVGGWDQAAVNALKCRVGYSSDITPIPYWENLMVEVSYIEQTGNTYYEAPANAFSSTPAQSHSTFLAISPSLAAFVSTPALNRAVSADLLGGISLASIPVLSRAAVADFFTTLTLPSTPAASMMGGMDLFNVLTLLSSPAAAMAYFLGIFPTLTLLSGPALSTSALTDFLAAVTLASTPAAVMAAIGNFFKGLTLASNPAWSAIGGSDFYNTLTLASSPAFSDAAYKDAFGSVTLPSNPALIVANIANLLAAITLSSTPGLTPAAARDILVAIALSSGPAFATAGGMNLYNAIALSSNPALAAAVFKEAFPSLSLASVPALSIAAQADLLAEILAASSPAFLAACGFDFIEAIILASGGVFALASDLTSGPVISVGAKRAAAGMVRAAIEASRKKAPETSRRKSP